MLTDDFEFADHRPTGFGSPCGADIYLELLQTAVEQVPDRTIELLEPADAAPDGVVTARATGTDEFGSPVMWEFLTLWRLRDGKLASLDVFSTDDLGLASERARSTARD